VCSAAATAPATPPPRGPGALPLRNRARVHRAHTNIGIDDRSQFDLFDAMPGGVVGVRRVVDELHAAGVRVLIPYNP
jgi:hypothetical protein